MHLELSAVSARGPELSFPSFALSHLSQNNWLDHPEAGTYFDRSFLLDDGSTL